MDDSRGLDEKNSVARIGILIASDREKSAENISDHAEEHIKHKQSHSCATTSRSTLCNICMFLSILAALLCLLLGLSLGLALHSKRSQTSLLQEVLQQQGLKSPSPLVASILQSGNQSHGFNNKAQIEGHFMKLKQAIESVSLLQLPLLVFLLLHRPRVPLLPAGFPERDNPWPLYSLG